MGSQDFSTRLKTNRLTWSFVVTTLVILFAADLIGPDR